MHVSQIKYNSFLIDFYYRLCFPLWILTNILFFVLLKYGAYFLTLTGTCMVVSNIIWATIRNPNELAIPFEEGQMTFSYGGSFYICLITGKVVYIYLDDHVISQTS